MKTKAGVHIRWMIRRDMEEVLLIENEVFPFPWSEEDFAVCMRGRNTIGMVAEVHGYVAGYMVYELRKRSLLLLNFAVDRCHQRQGVGLTMIDRLKGKLGGPPRNRRFMETHVREGNLDACLFFKAMGFQATGVLRDYYDESPEDAYRFEFRI
jgi:ribosomal-protein-alanine N-acetyltransferase